MLRRKRALPTSGSQPLGSWNLMHSAGYYKQNSSLAMKRNTISSRLVCAFKLRGVSIMP